MIESPKNFIEQFQNFIEHIAGVMKTFLTKEVADSYYLGKSEKAVSAGTADTAGSATKATQDASGNVITSTYATKTELTSGLSGKLGKTEKASSANTADAVAWAGVTGKPSFATVAITGNYNDLKNKPKYFPEVSGNVVRYTYSNGGRPISSYYSYTIPVDAIFLTSTVTAKDNTGYNKTYRLLLNDHELGSKTTSDPGNVVFGTDAICAYVKANSLIKVTCSRNPWYINELTISYLPVQ